MALTGKTVVFIGTLEAMKRAEAKLWAENAGAKVTTSISSKTNIVVAGSDAAEKSAEASAKGIDVWDEAKFLAAVKPKPAKGKGKKAALKEEEEEPEKPVPPPKKASKKAPDAVVMVSVPAPAAPAAPVAPVAAESTPTATSAAPRGRVVDREVPDRGKFKIFEDYAVLLNQTNIDGNNNKFYVIQVLQHSDGRYFSWNRWGRVGEPGQNKLEPHESAAVAIDSFKKKYRDKTANDWAKRDNFTPREGKYTLVETDEQEGGGGDSSAPMGKLSVSQIEKGQAILDRIESALGKASEASSLTSLSSQFFTLIPTNFGRQRPQPITTLDTLREKQELLKFYLRMGFEEVEDTDSGATPISGVMNLPVPPTLIDAAHGCCDSGSITSSVSKGADLAKVKAGNPILPMNKEEYGSIMLYTSNAIYRELNKVLRDENRAGVKRFFKYLRLLFAAADKLPKKESRLWRGISVDLSQQYRVGSTITWWGVSSCTADQTVARNFMNGCGGDCSLLTIDTKTAVDISTITFYSNEKESLLLPGTQLLVKSCVKKGKVAEIHLEEVGRLVS